MIRMLATVLLLTGCATYETVRDADGEVYECELRDGTTSELCFYEDSADELTAMLDARSCQLTDRWWPVITNALGRGCRYVCPGLKGCNAKQGCFCPM